MEHPAPSLHRARLVQMLTTVLDHAFPTCAAFDYRLVGTGAALLHGVDLPAGDVDILAKERSAVDALGAALAAFPCLEPPAWLAEAWQYYANYDVDGVEVGISTVEVESDADTIECIGRGPWMHYELLPCGPYYVPTVALELRLITELHRNRPDRCEPLIRYMQAHGCDTDLLRRGVPPPEWPQATRSDALCRLLASPSQPRA